MSYSGKTDNELLSLLKDLTGPKNYDLREFNVVLNNGEIVGAVFGVSSPLIRRNPVLAIYPYPDDNKTRKYVIKRESIKRSMKALSIVPSGSLVGTLFSTILIPETNPFAIFTEPTTYGTLLLTIILGGMVGTSAAAYFGRKKDEYLYMSSAKFLQKYGRKDFENLLSKVEVISASDYRF